MRDLWIFIKCMENIMIKFPWRKALTYDNDDDDHEYYYYDDDDDDDDVFICYTNLTSESEPSRNQWPKFAVPKEMLFVRLTHERFYFYKLDHKINWILLMLKGNFFCTVALSWILFW